MFGNLFQIVVNAVNTVVQAVADVVGGGWLSEGVQDFTDSVNDSASGSNNTSGNSGAVDISASGSDVDDSEYISEDEEGKDKNNKDGNKSKKPKKPEKVIREFQGDEIEDEEAEEYFAKNPGTPQYLHLYANPDALFLMRDFKTRPLTMQTIFKLKSPMDALDFLYSDKLNLTQQELNDVIEMSKQQDTSSKMISDPLQSVGDDYRIDLGESVVKFFVNVFAKTPFNFAKTLSTDEELEKSVKFYESMIEGVFGYDVQFDDDASPQDKIQQLQNLATANLEIVSYFDEVFKGDDTQSGLSILNQYFSQTSDGQLIVQLGADDKTGGEFYGQVPLADNAPEEDRKSIYLGSEVSIPTIVHEFGHVLDRNVGVTDHLNEPVQLGDRSLLATKADVNLDSFQVYTWGIQGFAAKQSSPDEVWGDLFMTAVLAESSQQYDIQTVNIPANLPTEPGDFFNCETDEGGCSPDSIIRWREPNNIALKLRDYRIGN